MQPNMSRALDELRAIATAARALLWDP